MRRDRAPQRSRALRADPRAGTGRRLLVAARWTVDRAGRAGTPPRLGGARRGVRRLDGLRAAGRRVAAAALRTFGAARRAPRGCADDGRPRRRGTLAVRERIRTERR